MDDLVPQATQSGTRQVRPPAAAGPATTALGQRRYDVDWLRTLAMGLLIVYHAAITFQPWGWAIGFPVSETSLEGLWIVLAAVNVWRIPIIFIISGMGVRFSMERRSLPFLLKDRTVRILLPFVFGFFAIGPLVALGALWFYEEPLVYYPSVAHLWFLGNIYLYVVVLAPLLYILKNRPANPLFRLLRWLFHRPVGLFLTALPLITEAWLVNPATWEEYAGTVHGLLLGLVCFFSGFLFISVMDSFWPAVKAIRWPALAAAFLLYLARLAVPEVAAARVLTAFESTCWMLAIFGFGSLYLNGPSRSLRFFSRAVYPVYILHLPVQFLLSIYLLPLELPPFLSFLLLTAGTLGVCLFLYEFLLKRIRWVRPLFGMKVGGR